MKKFSVFIIAAVAALSFVSCQKNDRLPNDSEGQEIVLNFGDSFDVETKASAVTSLTSAYWGASTGTSTESVKWSTASASVSSGKISTGKYQTASPTSYNYYVANQTFTVAGDMTVADNSNDIVAGRLAASTSTAPSVTLNHIFSRINTLTANAPSGFTISGISWKITGYSTVNGTAGTFNMKSQSWTSASTKIASATNISTGSDMYVIPGEYTFTVSYTLTKGDWSKSFTKSGRVTLTGGKINNISTTVPDPTGSTGGPEQIVLTVTITAWTSQNVGLTVS